MLTSLVVSPEVLLILCALFISLLCRKGYWPCCVYGSWSDCEDAWAALNLYILSSLVGRRGAVMIPGRLITSVSLLCGRGYWSCCMCGSWPGRADAWAVLNLYILTSLVTCQGVVMLLGGLIACVYLLCSRGCWPCCVYGSWLDCEDAWTDLNLYILSSLVGRRGAVMIPGRLITSVSLLCGRGYWSCCMCGSWPGRADAWADLNLYMLTSLVTCQGVVMLLGGLIACVYLLCSRGCWPCYMFESWSDRAGVWAALDLCILTLVLCQGVVMLLGRFIICISLLCDREYWSYCMYGPWSVCAEPWANLNLYILSFLVVCPEVLLLIFTLFIFLLCGRGCWSCCMCGPWSDCVDASADLSLYMPTALVLCAEVLLRLCTLFISLLCSWVCWSCCMYGPWLDCVDASADPNLYIRTSLVVSLEVHLLLCTLFISLLCGRRCWSCSMCGSWSDCSDILVDLNLYVLTSSVLCQEVAMLTGRLIICISLLCGRRCWSCSMCGSWSDCSDAWADLNLYVLTSSVLCQEVAMLTGRLIICLSLLCGRRFWSCSMRGSWSDCSDAWDDLNLYVLASSVFCQEIVVLLGRLITCLSLMCGRRCCSCCVYAFWSDCADAWADLGLYMLHVTSSMMCHEHVMLLGRSLISLLL